MVVTTACTAKETKRPNIAFLLSDDQPLRAMSHIDPWFSTPNIDRLARKGVVFDNALRRAKLALDSASKKTKVRAVLWLQGESDGHAVNLVRQNGTKVSGNTFFFDPSVPDKYEAISQTTCENLVIRDNKGDRLKQPKSKEK